jgi:hypothetical protein
MSCLGLAQEGALRGYKLGELRHSTISTMRSTHGHLLQVLAVDMLIAASISKVHSAALSCSGPGSAVTIL